MKTLTLSWIATCVAMTLAGAAAAQSPAPTRPASAPAAAASRPAAPTPPTDAIDSRVRTTPEASRAAMNPDDNRPYGSETTAVPQMRIPLGKKPPPSDAAPVRSGIDDGAARCEAMRGEQARVKCREEMRLDARAKAPPR